MRWAATVVAGVALVGWGFVMILGWIDCVLGYLPGYTTMEQIAVCIVLPSAMVLALCIGLWRLHFRAARVKWVLAAASVMCLAVPIGLLLELSEIGH